MKKILLVVAVSCLAFMVACGGGGGLDDALNPYGFVVSKFDSTNTNLPPGTNIRALARLNVNSNEAKKPPNTENDI